MSEIFFSDCKLEKDTEYFLYIGELKNYWLNSFLSESLSKILRRKVGFIAVVPDVLQHYAYENLIVLNPEAEQFYREHHCKICCRISGRDFMSAVSENPVVLELVETLKKRQQRLYVHMFESLPEMTLDKIPGVTVLGPDSAAAHRMNNKIFQYVELSKILPMPEHLVCDGLGELIDDAGKRLQAWPDGIFVTEEYSAAGVKSIVATLTDQIVEKFVDKDRRYLISRYIPHLYDPTVLAAVANENDVYVAGVADQRIEQGNRFTGSTYPTVLSEKIVERLVDFTKKAGRWLGSQGYRGIFGCDYIVDENDDIRFLEINARKQGTTMEFCCTLEQSLPPRRAQPAGTRIPGRYRRKISGKYDGAFRQPQTNPLGDLQLQDGKNGQDDGAHPPGSKRARRLQTGGRRPDQPGLHRSGTYRKRLRSRPGGLCRKSGGPGYGPGRRRSRPFGRPEKTGIILLRILQT